MTDNEINTPYVHSWSVMGERFDLPDDYKIIDYLGAGAYGVVCAAVDSKTNRVVAIKKCKHIFQTRTLAKRTLREVRLLRLLEHENVIKLLSILKPPGLETFQCIYAVFEIMETDLASIIKSGQKLCDQHVQYFTLQIVRALDYIHSSKIVHRDLKPRNLLVNGDCKLKLADFGLARFYDASSNTKCVSMTEYVTTRWYRAPEILVGWRTYDYSVDMWATGCIIAELLGRRPLFPGSDAINQIEHICSILGKPEEDYIAKSRKTAYREILRNLQVNYGRQEFKDIYRGANPAAVDLLDSLLRFDPGHRMSASAALMHPYMQNLQLMTLQGSDTRDSVCRVSVDISDQFSFEETKLPIEALRCEIIRECRSYHEDDWDDTLEEEMSASNMTSIECGSAPASAASEQLLSASAFSPDPDPPKVDKIENVDAPIVSKEGVGDGSSSVLTYSSPPMPSSAASKPSIVLRSLGLLCHSGDSEEYKSNPEISSTEFQEKGDTEPKMESEGDQKKRRTGHHKSADHKGHKACLLL